MPTNYFYQQCVRPHFNFLVKEHGFKVDVPESGKWIEASVCYSTELVELDICFLINDRLSGMAAYQWTGRYWKTINIIQIVRSRAKGTKYQLPYGLWGERRKFSDADVLRYMAVAMRNCVPEFFRGQLLLPVRSRTEKTKTRFAQKPSRRG